MSQPSSYLKLTRQQRLYVDARLDGLSQVAAATAAGCGQPRTEGSRLEKNERVQAALVDRMSRLADEVDFSRKEAHDMYMQAYQSADTAMEQIAAVNAMVKLHGLEKPKQLEVKHEHTHKGELELLPTEELMKLAGMEDALVLDGEFEEVGEAPRLEPPKPTEDNVDDPTKLPNVQDDY